MRNPALNLIMDCFMLSVSVGLALFSALKISEGQLIFILGFLPSVVIIFLSWISLYEDLDAIKKIEREESCQME